MGLLNEPNRLEHICDIIQSANLRFEGFVIDRLIVGDLASGLLKRDHSLPPHEEVDKLLAEISKGFDLLVFGLSFALLAHGAVFVI